MRLRHVVALAAAATAARSFGQSFTSGLQTGIVQNSSLTEDSGVAYSRVNPNVLWSHNDSGHPAQIFAMTPQGTDLGVYNISGASNTDWEDIDVGPGPVAGQEYVYTGDIGDNNLNRAKIEVYRIPEPAVSDTQASVTTTITGADKFTFVYPDGPHDAESLFVDPLTKDIYIITKRDTTFKYVYEAPYPQSTSGTMTLTLAATLTNSNALTAADISPDGSEIVIRSYATGSGLLYHRPPGGTVAATFATTPVKIPLVTQQQGEGIGFDPQGRGYFLTSEGLNQPIYYFDLLPPPEANYYWDTDGVTAGNRTATGSSMGGTGTWNGANTNWYNAAVNVTWQNKNDAIFWGTAGIVTLGSAQSVNSLSFKTTGYTLTSSTLTLTGPSITVEPNVTAKIASVVAGTSGLSKLGTGTLTLSGTNTYTGGTTIHAGTLTITTDSNLGATSSNITIDGGTLSLANTAAITINANRSLTITANGGTIDSNIPDGTSNDYSGAISGPASAILTKTGTGNFFLHFNSSNYLGKWVINGGEINPGNATTADAGWGAVPAQFVPDFITLNNTGTGALAGIRAGAGAVYTLNANRGITLGSHGGTVDTVASNAALTIASVISGPGSLIFTSSAGAPGLVTLSAANTYTGGTTVAAGTLVLANSKALGTGGLTITGSAIVKLNASLSNPISLPSLSIASGAQLDLANNDLILNYTGSSLAPTIRSLLAQGYSAGNWNGSGITSSSAASTANRSTALGYAEASDLGVDNGGSFDGQSIANQAVLIKYTYYGDDNLDGVVNLDDFSIFIDGFNGLGSGWIYGDFNYDGVIDQRDFSIFINGFNLNGQPLSQLRDAILANGELSSAQKSAILSAVPEPGTLSLLAIAVIPILTRRGRTDCCPYCRMRIPVCSAASIAYVS